MARIQRTPKHIYGDRSIRYYHHEQRYSPRAHVVVIEGPDEWQGPEVARFETRAMARKFWLINVREWLREGKQFCGVAACPRAYAL